MAYTQRTQVGTVKLDGKKYTIEVDEEGTWSAVIGDDDELTAATKAALLDRLRRYRRQRTPLSIPATRITLNWSGGFIEDFSRVTVTGLHSRNRSILYTDAAGKKHTDGDHSDFYAPMSPEEIAHGRSLHAAKIAASEAWEAFKDKHEIHIIDQIKRANGDTEEE